MGLVISFEKSEFSRYQGQNTLSTRGWDLKSLRHIHCTGFQDISVRDTEVHLYFHQPIQTISKNTNLVSKSLQSIMQRCCVEIKIKNGDKCLK